MSNKGTTALTHLAERSITYPLFYNGRFLIIFTGLVLVFSGIFVIVQSFTGHFLPHDVKFLGMSAEKLSQFYSGRINNFMYHDRVAFGGSIIAVGAIYMWLAEFPLKNGHGWAWWILMFSGIIGFGSFLTYLGYGYLDEWHGIATLLLLPFFIVGMLRSRKFISTGKAASDLLRVVNKAGFTSLHGFGLLLLQLTGGGLFAGGLTIMGVGMTTVFVPQDLQYMQVISCGNVAALNQQLVPLIAHDRACFGGGVATIGLIIFFTVRRAEERKSMWEILFVSINTGFLSAIGIHYYIGYTDFFHLSPAIAGYLLAMLGMLLTYRRWMSGKQAN